MGLGGTIRICLMAIGCSSTWVIGAYDVQFENARFARDVYSSRSSILIIGDSTTNPRGDLTFVSYFEGMILELPESVELCGFRIAGSPGNTGVHQYTMYSGGQPNQLVGGGVYVAIPTDDVAGQQVAIPGPRNEFQVIEGGALLETGRVASVGITNLEGIYQNAEEWAVGSTLVLRTSFLISDQASSLRSFSLAKLSDHDHDAGNNVREFDIDEEIDVQLGSSRVGLEYVDLAFPNVPTSRVGLLLRGDSNNDDGDESGASLAWGDHVLFREDKSLDDIGFYLDSISVGGYTAKDHDEHLDDELLGDYLQQAPRQMNTLMIWIGQNAEPDEWNGVLEPIWIERIERVTDRAIAASLSNNMSEPRVILCTPPNANAVYPSLRFTAMNQALAALAEKRGWGHFDFQSLIGQSLISLDPSFLGPGAHPSESGSRYVSSLFYSHLDCIRTDYNGDGYKDFFDVSIFLEHYLNQNEEADLNGDRVFDFFDVSDFLASFAQQCD